MAQTDSHAIILLSGGLDSATLVPLAQAAGHRLHALSFRYGQRHSVELVAARRVAEASGIADHRIADIDLRLFGGSALTDSIDVPKGRDAARMAEDIPVTYVPARNTIFLAFALAYAEVVSAEAIYIGVNALDYSGYPDCRPEFISAFQTLANLATKSGVTGSQPVRIETPLIDLTKAEIIGLGEAHGVDYSLTLSCYDPDAEGRACGACDSCILRREGFRAAGVPDPTRYQ